MLDRAPDIWGERAQHSLLEQLPASRDSLWGNVSGGGWSPHHHHHLDLCPFTEVWTTSISGARGETMTVDGATALIGAKIHSTSLLTGTNPLLQRSVLVDLVAVEGGLHRPAAIYSAPFYPYFTH